jgi:hypothetical protein
MTRKYSGQTLRFQNPLTSASTTDPISTIATSRLEDFTTDDVVIIVAGSAIASVPEPTSLALFVPVIAFLAMRRRASQKTLTARNRANATA